ncbi:MAG TPA: YdeI/OmpD-associated family protein [Gemmatimonadaceae bacterium]|nr:YdeI/OmpD-associated family protein [Gemmatimonadaceae bacterium]
MAPPRRAAPPGATFFADPAAWRRWLERHHATDTELWVGFYKKATGRPSITWPESVDGALCFGWIDGVRKSIDESSYRIRFTPRRPRSIWSAVNLRRVQALIEAGLVAPAGMRAFEARDPKRSGLYSFEQRKEAALAPADEARFRANAGAWKFFQARPPGYRRMATWWVVSAKREATRQRRLAALIEDSARGRAIGLARPAKK